MEANSWVILKSQVARRDSKQSSRQTVEKTLGHSESNKEAKPTKLTTYIRTKYDCKEISGTVVRYYSKQSAQTIPSFFNLFIKTECTNLFCSDLQWWLCMTAKFGGELIMCWSLNTG